MDKHEGKKIDFESTRKELVGKREALWADFYNKYDGMDQVIEDEAILTDEEGEIRMEEEDERDASDMCIEISDDDDDDSDVSDGPTTMQFAETFKEVAQQSVQILNEIYEEEHYSDEIKTKDMTRSIKKSFVKKGKCVSTASGNMKSGLPNALTDISNINAITNNNENNLALVESHKSMDMEPFGDEITNINEVTNLEPLKHNGVEYIQQTITTTTTTTTTTTERIIIKNNLNDIQNIDTPKKGTSINAPKSVRKKRQSSESEQCVPFDYDHDDFQSYSTPKTNRRSAVSRFKTPVTQKKNNLLAITNTPNLEVIIATPKTPNRPNSAVKQDLGKILIKKNQIKKKLNSSLSEIQLNKNDLNNIARDVRINENETLSIVKIEENGIIDSPDPLMRLKSRKSTIFVKDRDAYTVE